MGPLPFELSAVASVHRPSTAEFDRLKQDGRPVVITGCLDEWPLYQEFRALSSHRDRLQYLRIHAAGERVSFVVVPAEAHGHLYFANGLNTKGEKLERSGLVSQCLQRFGLDGQNAAVVYMHAIPIDNLPGLAAKIELLSYLQRALLESVNVWIGPGGQVVDLHYDLDHNFLAMVSGEKRVILAPPEVTHDLYPRALDRAPYGATASSVKLLGTDFTEFPRFRKAAAQFCAAVLRPGAVLYIPPYWWHHVESFGLNLMVNVWQRTVAPEEFTPVAVLRRKALQIFASQPEKVRAAYWVRYAEEVFGIAQGGAGGGEPSDSARRQSSRTLESLFEKTRAAMRIMPACVRRGEAAFYEQWVFRTLGDPIENQPGEFKRMIRRMRRASRSEPQRPILQHRIPVVKW